MGLAPDENSSGSGVLQALDRYLSTACASLKDATSDTSALEELAFECGSLWGNQLAAEFGWKWVRVKFQHLDTDAVGIASGDASLVIYPFQTIFLYCEQILPVRVTRSFEVLSEPGRVPMLPPGGLENVMDHIP